MLAVLYILPSGWYSMLIFTYWWFVIYVPKFKEVILRVEFSSVATHCSRVRVIETQNSNSLYLGTLKAGPLWNQMLLKSTKAWFAELLIPVAIPSISPSAPSPWKVSVSLNIYFLEKELSPMNNIWLGNIPRDSVICLCWVFWPLKRHVLDNKQLPKLSWDCSTLSSFHRDAMSSSS